MYSPVSRAGQHELMRFRHSRMLQIAKALRSAFEGNTGKGKAYYCRASAVHGNFGPHDVKSRKRACPPSLALDLLPSRSPVLSAHQSGAKILSDQSGSNILCLLKASSQS
eukprot:3161831-Rhodomonas_salina.1